jgi:hypothetical protein
MGVRKQFIVEAIMTIVAIAVFWWLLDLPSLM